jgi:hypothetical protein
MSTKTKKKQFVPADPNDKALVNGTTLLNEFLDDFRRCKGREATEPEMELIADAVQTVSRLYRVVEQVEEEGLTVKGSTGQTKVHPLLKLEKELRREFKDSLARLDWQ